MYCCKTVLRLEQTKLLTAYMYRKSYEESIGTKMNDVTPKGQVKTQY